MAGNGNSGRKPYKNQPIHKANMKIKKLERDVEQLAVMLGKSDTLLHKLENQVNKTDLDIHTVDVCRQDAESDLLRMIRRLETNNNVVYGKNTKSRKRRMYHPLSILYSRKTRRGIRVVAICSTAIFAGAYALSLLLQ